MSDLKLLYDRVLTAQAKVEAVKNQITDALALGTPEGEEQALGMESTLDEAITEETKWHALYDKAVNASKDAGTLKHFVPAIAESIPAEGEVDDGKIVSREEFNALNTTAREKFINAGGTVVDHKE